MKILVVDDEKLLVKGITFNLQNEGYEVEAAYDGATAVELARRGDFDLIILDWMMPEKSGSEACMEIRTFSDVPIIMLTAKSELDDKVRGLDCGADDYLTKPFQTKELLARLRAITRRKGEIESNIITFGDLQLNTGIGEISCTTTGKSMKLGLKEFQLLEFLLKNKNQIISKEQIVEKLWGLESDSEYNNAEVYVSFTRKKIKFVGSKVAIKAVRGLGYTLEDGK